MTLAENLITMLGFGTPFLIFLLFREILAMQRERREDISPSRKTLLEDARYFRNLERIFREKNRQLFKQNLSRPYTCWKEYLQQQYGIKK